MAPYFTAHYLFIPSDTNQPIQEVDCPVGSTTPEHLSHIAKLRQVFRWPAYKKEIIYSSELENQLLGQLTDVGEKFTAYDAYLAGDPTLPHNTRAAELPLTPAHQLLHGPVLLSMTHYLLGPFDWRLKTGSGRPTVAHLQSEEFREKRRRFLRIMDEKGVEIFVVGPPLRSTMIEAMGGLTFGDELSSC